jgi:mono/diheme cytochrome c family protein
MWRRIVKWLLIALATLAAGVGIFVFWHVRQYDQSTSKVYEVPPRPITLSSDAATLERGKHLAESLGECTVCHGDNFAGGRVENMGPLGRVVIPNATAGARLNAYSDAELARLIRHGIKRDGTTVRLMPSSNNTWWPDEDVAALIAWLRARPAVQGDPGVFEVTAMGKVLDRLDSIPIDVARRIDHQAPRRAPKPNADAHYGSFVGTSCRGCHGVTLAGGPIPGAPPGMAVPLNLTKHETGLAGWSYADFKTLVQTGKRKNGRKLDAFMPVESLRAMNDVELEALWLYLQSVPPRPFGERS